MKHLPVGLLTLLIVVLLAGCSLSPIQPDNSPAVESAPSRQLDTTSPSSTISRRPTRQPLVNRDQISQLMQSETHLITVAPGGQTDPANLTANLGDFLIVKNSDTTSHQIQLADSPAVTIASGSGSMFALKSPGEYRVTVDGRQVSLVQVR